MIFIFTGESACGKTTLVPLVSEIMKLEKNIGYTTRPKRIGEIYGIHNYFVNDYQLDAMGDDIIVKREYFPASGGIWTYGMSKSSFNENFNYAVILDPLGAQQLKEIFPDSKIIYIKVPEAVRRERAYGRENKQADPEIERRFEADAIDFKDFTKIADINIMNINIQESVNAICQYIVRVLMTKKFSEKLMKYGEK